MTEQPETMAPSGDEKPLVVRVVQLSDVGRVRTENQDFSIQSTPEDEVDRHKGRLLVVADGMGGHRGGATASRMAATIIKDEFFRDADTDVAKSLHAALETANLRIYNESQLNAELRGMGTTCSALVVRGREAFFAHVGDSRIYMVRDGEIRQLTDDHSLVASMVREGLLTSQEAEVHPRRNVLQRSMGVGQAVEIDQKSALEVRPGDTFILCSDGLHGLVKSEEMLEIAKLPIEDAAREFVRRAMERGAPDNVTVIVACIEETTEEAIAAEEAAAREAREKARHTGFVPTEEIPITDSANTPTQKITIVDSEDEAGEDADTDRKLVAKAPKVAPAAPSFERAPSKGGGGSWIWGVLIIAALAAAVAMYLMK